MHNSIRIESVFHVVKVAGSKQVGHLQHHLVTLFIGFHIRDPEISARLFPDLQTGRCPIAVVVVVGCPPEVGLQAEPMVKIVDAAHLIGGDDSLFLVEAEEQLAPFYFNDLTFLRHFPARVDDVAGILLALSLKRQPELLEGYLVTCRQQLCCLLPCHLKVEEIFSPGFGCDSRYRYLYLG